MTEDNPPIAQPDPASLGNQLPLSNTPNNQHEHAGTGATETVVGSNDSNSGDSNNNTVHAMEGDSHATTAPATSGHKNLSFANKNQGVSHHEAHHHHDHQDQVEEIPTVLTAVAPSTVEGYSIYSNIKDGKVPILNSTPFPPYSTNTTKWIVFQTVLVRPRVLFVMRVVSCSLTYWFMFLTNQIGQYRAPDRDQR